MISSAVHNELLDLNPNESKYSKQIYISNIANKYTSVDAYVCRTHLAQVTVTTTTHWSLVINIGSTGTVTQPVATTSPTHIHIF